MTNTQIEVADAAEPDNLHNDEEAGPNVPFEWRYNVVKRVYSSLLNKTLSMSNWMGSHIQSDSEPY